MAPVASSPERTEFFQQLKKVCVPLSQLALRPKDQAVDSKEALKLLDSLASLWTAQASKDASILDEKLADYVFFPLSHLLRNRGRYPMRVVETIIRLLRELIRYGWKARASPQLFQQLLVFLSFTIGGVPGQPKHGMPEETMIEGFRTLSTLVSIAELSHLPPPADSPTESKTTPALGHSITVMLDGVTDSPVSLVQIEAAECLRTVFTKIKDNTILAQFLPGTISALAKVLSPPQANQTQKRVLLSCLDVLKLVLINVLGDIKVRGLLKKLETATETAGEAASETADSNLRGELTPSWLKATTSQIKIALAAVLKLRAHESEEVQSALHGFCVSLLDECHSSLAGCQLILVETAMMLEDENAPRSHLQTSLQDLAGVYPELADNIKTALYNWVTGLPRIMQSNDENIKQRAIRSILRGSRLADALRFDSSTLEDALGDSLRDSIITLVKGSKEPKIMDDSGVDISSSTDLVASGTELATYAPVLLNSEGQKTTRKEVATLISTIGSAAHQVKLATSMLSHVRDSEGVDQIASFWLAFELLKATYAQSSDMDELFDLSSLGESRYQEEAFQELYDFSASILSTHSDSVEADWRLEAIALEVTAFAASRLKADFRPELIDVLYPVTTFLGSPGSQLRRHAITTLNIIAASCGYGNVSDLIVDNADYMVNSISLRLNTFDISPASTKVLTMVIRLTGPRLIPYLDDVVAAIFAALDNYHGYPAFVEGLFAVLSEVVTQGVKSDTLLLEAPDIAPINHRKRKPFSQGIPGTLQTLSKRQHRATPNPSLTNPTLPNPGALPKMKLNPSWTNSPPLPAPPHPHPTHPLRTAHPPNPNLPAPNPHPHHHPLPPHHPSPTLRLSLLHLITRVTPALAQDETTFLPVVHSLWPVVLARLWDAEGQREEKRGEGGGGSTGSGVGGSGGIMIPIRTREGTEEGRLVQRSMTGSALGRLGQAAQLWEAVLGMLAAIVGYVRIEDEMFDDILGLVVDVLPRHRELREALETVNADAVWLAMYERGMVRCREAPPAVEGFTFQFARVDKGAAVEVGV